MTAAGREAPLNMIIIISIKMSEAGIVILRYHFIIIASTELFLATKWSDRATSAIIHHNNYYSPSSSVYMYSNVRRNSLVRD